MTWNELVSSRWEGKCELWEDPLGDVAQTCDCTIAIDDGELTYTWSYKGKPHVGKLKMAAAGATYTDTWHQQTPIACAVIPDTPAIATVKYTYMEDWGWRIGVCLRQPTDELVVQMTNIAPWGEETRAVRMIAKRVAT